MMAKLLAAGGVVLLGLLAFLLLQLNSSSETSAAPSPEKIAAAAPVLSSGAAIKPVAAPVAPPVDDGKPKKLDPQSDAFFFQFDEVVPGKLMSAAAECYHGGLDSKHRNAKLRIGFDNVIKDGVVRVENLKVLEIEKGQMGLNDPAMESCMLSKISAVVWKNEALPDGRWDDRLVIRPGRGLKKYSKENMEYEGDG
ncbi:MAG: hypothetical protein H0T79_13740, partial [Deltaproteobacteria bacterium]|nr:hypothetical protein [Deltaproteobacteria bacterium]